MITLRRHPSEVMNLPSRSSVPLFFEEKAVAPRKPTANKAVLEHEMVQSLQTLDDDCDALDLFVERMKGKVQ